jgi:hypothetical protein
MPATAMTREALAALVVVPVRREALRVLRLRAGDERRQPLTITGIGADGLLIVLRLRLCLRLSDLLRSAERLRLALRVGLLLVAEGGRDLHRLTLARLAHVVAFIVEGVIAVAFTGGRWRLIVRVLLAKLFLRCRDQAVVMLGVLVVVFGGDRIA